MKKEWYVSFHGGDERAALNNIHVFSTEGAHLRKALKKESLPAGVTLRELRGFAFGPDGDLYVANAFQDYSQILRFQGKLDDRGTHVFRDVFTQYDAASNPGLKHPFDVAFDRTGDLYVTAQDTNITLRYHGPRSKTGKPGTPMPLPTALTEKAAKALHPGTFCPSATEAANGLRVVRKTIFAKDLLFVADRDGDCIRTYHPSSGSYVGTISAKGLIDKPIHLACKDDVMFIGNKGNETVVRYDLRNQAVAPFIASRSGGLKNPSGIAFDGRGYLHVASRGSRQILRYDLQSGVPDKHPFIDGLADDPEFIALISRS